MGKDWSEEGGQILQTSASPLGEVKDVSPAGETCRFLLWRDILPAAGHTQGLHRQSGRPAINSPFTIALSFLLSQMGGLK